MTVEGWITHLSRLPRDLEVVIGDTDPMSEEFLRAAPYPPEPVYVPGRVNKLRCVVVGMELGKPPSRIIRQAGARTAKFLARKRMEFDEGESPGEGF